MTKTHLLLMDSRMARTHTATAMTFGFMGPVSGGLATLAVFKQDNKRPLELPNPTNVIVDVTPPTP